MSGISSKLRRRSSALLLTSLAVAALSASDRGVNAQQSQASKSYTTPIPAEIFTPDTVKTSAGTFRFFDGMPDEATVRTSFDNLKFIRGYETFLTLMPAASIEMMRHGHAQVGVDDHTKVALMSPLYSNPLFLTGNTDTIYGSTFFNLQDTGPMVIEIPAGLGPGTINDAFFRFVADTGAPGPDKGKGGKYLILGPDDTEPSNVGDYFVFRSPTYSNWLILRAFLDSNGKPDKAIANYENGLRLYPYSQKDNPPQMSFIKVGEKVFNTVHANNFEFFNELNTVIQREPIAFLDPELRGLASSIGLEKGKPFAPSPQIERFWRKPFKWVWLMCVLIWVSLVIKMFTSIQASNGSLRLAVGVTSGLLMVAKVVVTSTPAIISFGATPSTRQPWC